MHVLQKENTVQIIQRNSSRNLRMICFLVLCDIMNIHSHVICTLRMKMWHCPWHSLAFPFSLDFQTLKQRPLLNP